MLFGSRCICSIECDTESCYGIWLVSPPLSLLRPSVPTSACLVPARDTCAKAKREHDFISPAFGVTQLSLYKVTGGNFTANLADFGGFLYKDGAGLATCTAASITDHQGVNGGAIYAVGEAEIEWECDVGRSHALSGPAM